MKYVNAYAVDRVYGGPEEGGWWYDAGVFLDGITITPTDDPEQDELKIEDAREKLEKRFGEDYEGNRHRGSAIGQENLEIYVEDHEGADFPDRTPHYE